MAAKARQAARLIPFTRAAHEHVEPMFDVTSAVISANTQAFGPFDVPAYGYLRAIWLKIVCDGVTIGPGVVADDGPWNLLQNISLNDVNGAPIVGPAINGYDLYLINRYGAYCEGDLPNLYPYLDLTSGDFQFALRVPVEINKADGYGALANQNAAQAYQFSFTIANENTIWSTPPTTEPTVRVRAWAECWSQPAEVDPLGNAQALMPPGHGTTQFWSTYVKSAGVGDNTVLLPRVGNLIRTLIVENYDDQGVRDDIDFPEVMQFIWDSRIVLNEAKAYRLWEMQRRYAQYGFAPPDGVYVYDFTHDGGGPGDESRNLWLPTVQATRLEFVGTWGASAGTLRILTNDVAPAVVAPPAGSPVQGT
jgi:hypothetical protein